MAGQLTIDTLKASSGVLATQNGMTGVAKAWVNFTGSTATINGSFNVSSITRNATGDYTVNFTTSMPSTAYSTVCGFSGVNLTNGIVFYPATQYSGVGYNSSYITTSSIRGCVVTGGGVAQDVAYMCIAVFSA